MTVVDAWDGAHGRWFNGPQAMSPEVVRSDVAARIKNFLRIESWIPGSPFESNFGPGGETPYMKARQQYLLAFDRTKTPSRTFADVSATIERYATFTEVRDGLATVRIAGTLVTTDAAGRSLREPFQRRVVMLFGNNGPEIVDEEIAPGKWVSGGDLALGVRDHRFRLMNSSPAVAWSR